MNPSWRGRPPFNRPPFLQRDRPNFHGPRPTRGAHAYGYHEYEAGVGHERYNEGPYAIPPRVRKSRWSDSTDQLPDSYQYERTEMARGAHLRYRAPRPSLFPPSNYTDQVTRQYPMSAHRSNEFINDEIPESYQEQNSTVGPCGYDQQGHSSADDKSSNQDKAEETKNLGPESDNSNQKKRMMEEDSNKSTGNMKKKVRKFCEVCNMLFISPEALEKHQSGLVHQQKLKEIEESEKKETAKKDDDEEEDDDDDDDEDTSYCKYCNQSFTDATSFYKHTRGMLHTQNLMAAESNKEREISEEQGPFTTVTTKSAKEETKDIKVEPVPLPERDDEDNWMDLDIKEEIPLEERDYTPEDIVSKTDNFLHCTVCNVTCSGETPMRQHLEGAKHRSKVTKLNEDDSAVVSKTKANETRPKLIDVSIEAMITKTLEKSNTYLIGLQYVTEFQPEEGNPRYVCNLCESKCDKNTLLNHLSGVKHRMKYFKFNHNDIYQHLNTNMNSKKKSDLNLSSEAFAADIIDKYGQQKVKVKLEISQRSTMVAEAILKRSGVDVTDSSVADFIKKKKALKHVRNEDDSDGDVSPLKKIPKQEKVEHEPQGDVSTATRGRGKTLKGRGKTLKGRGETLKAIREGGDLSSTTSVGRKLKSSAGYPYQLGGRDEHEDPEEDPYLRARKRKERYDYDDDESFWKKRQVFDYGHRDTSPTPSEKQVFEYDNKSLPGGKQVFDYDNKSLRPGEKQVFDYDNKSLKPGEKQVFDYDNKSLKPGEKQVFDYDNKPLRPGEKQVFEYSNKSSKPSKVQACDYSETSTRQRTKLVFDYDDTEEMSDEDYRDESSSPNSETEMFDVDYRDKSSATKGKKEVFDMDYRKKTSNIEQKQESNFQKNHKGQSHNEDKVNSKQVTAEDDFAESERLFREFMKWKKAAALSSSSIDPSTTVTTKTSAINSQTTLPPVTGTQPTASVTSQVNIPAAPHQLIQTMPMIPGSSGQVPYQFLTPPPVQPLGQAPNRHMVQPLGQAPNRHMVQPLGQAPNRHMVQPPGQAPVQPFIQAPNQHMAPPPVRPLVQGPHQQHSRPPVQPFVQASQQQHTRPPVQPLVQASQQQQLQPPGQPLIRAQNPQVVQFSPQQFAQVPAPQPVPPPSKQPVPSSKSKKPGVKETEEIPEKVNEMLGALSQTLINSEDEAAMALQVSNTLTQALLKFRLMKAPVQMGKSTKGDPQSQAIQEQNTMMNQLAQHHMQNMAKEQQGKSHQTDNKPPKSSRVETFPPPMASGKVPAHLVSPQSQPGFVPSSTGPMSRNQIQNTGQYTEPRFPIGAQQSQPGFVPSSTGPMSRNQIQNTGQHTQPRLPIGAQQFNAYSLKGERGEVKEEEMKAWKESLRRQALANAQSLQQPPLPQEMPPPPPPQHPYPKKPLPPLPKEPPPSQKRVFRSPVCMKVENVKTRGKQFQQPPQPPNH
ncbi:uncharacterized protein LOC117343429 isoform X2 [Pecten maximus]|uniref:uncharacterized protein LOC117343429 isoform X2 n=1 Tax=Pecten maximus TaxID=6579 RepID=UPI0014582F7B|nr:uncharacterized protein LOC117343429 isoform X2 [Pecten maximus]